MIDIFKEIKQQVRDYIYYNDNDRCEEAAWSLEGAIEDAQDEIFEGDRKLAKKYVSNLIAEMSLKGIYK